MTNQEAADELQYAIDLIKQDGKDWLDERDIPILEGAISALQAQENNFSQGLVHDEVLRILQQLPFAQPHSNESSETQKELDCISRQAAIDAIKTSRFLVDAMEKVIKLPSAQPEWNNHTVACLLAELFNDTCACNYNDIDEWLPEKCEVIDACPNPVGVACWEQYLRHRAERRTDEGD